MTVQELLRKLIDLVDEKQHQASAPVVVNVHNHISGNTDDGVVAPDEEISDELLPSMVSPLQQELEIQKRKAGVDNVFSASNQQEVEPAIKQENS